MPPKDAEYYRRWREANPEKAREYQRRWREKDPERARERDRRYREAHLEKVREACRTRAQRWRAANPERVRELSRQAAARRRARGEKPPPRSPAQTFAATIKRKYGLSVQQWEQLLADQDTLCYLCGESVDLENKRNIQVDHDHSCCPGQTSCGRCIRGLACTRCNVGIAMFGDDPDRMERAAAALRVAKAEVVARMPAKLVQTALFDVTECNLQAG